LRVVGRSEKEEYVSLDPNDSLPPVLLLGHFLYNLLPGSNFLHNVRKENVQLKIVVTKLKTNQLKAHHW